MCTVSLHCSSPLLTGRLAILGIWSGWWGGKANSWIAKAMLPSFSLQDAKDSALPWPRISDPFFSHFYPFVSSGSVYVLAPEAWAATEGGLLPLWPEERTQTSVPATSGICCPSVLPTVQGWSACPCCGHPGISVPQAARWAGDPSALVSGLPLCWTGFLGPWALPIRAHTAQTWLYKERPSTLEPTLQCREKANAITPKNIQQSIWLRDRANHLFCRHYKMHKYTFSLFGDDSANSSNVKPILSYWENIGIFFMAFSLPPQFLIPVALCTFLKMVASPNSSFY